MEAKNAEVADVYDIEVDGPPEFFANGILVHNSLRYAYKSFMSPARVPRAVQAAEVYNSYQDMTARAMALRKFEQKRLENSRIGKARAR